MKILKSNEFINENTNTELIEYLNKRKETLDKVFKVTGTILNYSVYNEMKPFNTGFNELALGKSYYEHRLFYTVYPLNNGKLIYDERGYPCDYRFDKFCKLVVSKDISIKSKKKLIDMVNYYLSVQDNKYYRDDVKDTDILDFLKPSADTYKRKGAIKISTSILKLIIEVKTSCETTKTKNEKGMFGMVSPLDSMMGYEVRELGKYFGISLSHFEGNDGANFMLNCGIYCKKVGENYEIVKNEKPYYGTEIQNKVYNILMKAQSFDLTNISNLYITNHKDTQSGKFIRKGYLSTAIKYLGMLIELKERDNYNSYSGRTFVELTFNKKDMPVYNEWIDVFNFDSTKFYMEKQGQNCVVTIKFKDFE